MDLDQDSEHMTACPMAARLFYVLNGSYVLFSLSYKSLWLAERLSLSWHIVKMTPAHIIASPEDINEQFLVTDYWPGVLLYVIGVS